MTAAVDTGLVPPIPETTVEADGLVPIEYISVAGRHRRDMGDIDALAASIADIGLLNAVTITGIGRLVAGQRRLEACRRLGWKAIPARFVDNLDEASAMLRAERDENTQRKDMLPSELVSLGRQLEELERPRAKARQGTRNDLTATSSSREDEVAGSTRTDEIVASALGMGESTYYRAKRVVEAAEDEPNPAVRVVADEALADMDATGNVAGNYDKITAARGKAARSAKTVLTTSSSEAEPAAVWVPAKGDTTTKATVRRRELIAELGAAGYSSDQIGERIHLSSARVRSTARDMGVQINADEAMGRRTRKSVDPNRVVRETVAALEAYTGGLRLVAYDDLDRDELPEWIASLAASIRSLNSLHKKLKEMAN